MNFMFRFWSYFLRHRRCAGIPQSEALMVPRIWIRNTQHTQPAIDFDTCVYIYASTASFSQPHVSFPPTSGLRLTEKGQIQSREQPEARCTGVLMTGIAALSQDSIRGVLANKHYLFIEKCSRPLPSMSFPEVRL